MKTRLDKLVHERGLAPSRERAQALILAGKVLVDEQKIDKPGTSVAEDAKLRILGDDLRYVSRGGLKLEHALRHWGVDVRGRTCMDVGASTGGFTDCLLQAGAARVIAVDTGYGQIASRLRDDPRVRLLERFNARTMQAKDIGETVYLVAMDVSFISATLVLPAVLQAARPELLIVLVKPQFEVGREKVGKGGIVRESTDQAAAVFRVEQSVLAAGGSRVEVIDSPILGAEGNKEFLLFSHMSL